MSLSGCLSDDDDTGAEDDGTTDGGAELADNGPVLPEPVAIELRHPEPRGVSTDSQHQRGDNYEFTVTVENTGTAGAIEMTHVLLTSTDQSIWSPLAEDAGTYERFFSDGERRTETFTGKMEAQHEAYGFRLTPAEAEVDVRNDGNDGAVDVQLVQRGGIADGTVIEHKTVDIPSDTTQTVQFDVDAEFALENDINEIQLDARVSIARSE